MGSLLIKNSDTAVRFITILNWIKNRTGRDVQRARSDRGSEYFSVVLQSLFSEHEIVHELTSSYSSQSKGKAERLSPTLFVRGRSILAEMAEINGGDPDQYHIFWEEAVNTASYVRKRVLNKVTAVHIGKITAYEILFGRKSDISNIWIFGSKVHVLRRESDKRG